MKQRLLIVSFLMVFLLSVFPAGAEDVGNAPNPAFAANITAKCTLTSVADTSHIKNLTDNSISTVWKSPKNGTLTIHSSEAIGSIYIKWDRNPVVWTLTSEENSGDEPLYKGDENSFLHEFVPLKTSLRSLTLNFSGGAAAIADIFVFAPGTAPSWVQQWQPMLQKADMLVYVAHADDELLWMGGTLPYYAGQEHKKVQVAYLIHHGGAPRYENMRNHELLDGLWTVGVTNYPMISKFEDNYSTTLQAALKTYGEDNVLNYTVMLFRRFKPDVVITHDVNGEYGHGVHRLCAYATQKAIYLSGNPSVYPATAKEYGTWKIKKCYLHLYSKNPVVMDWNQPLSAFGGKTGIDMAKQGYKCHVSQQKKWFRVEGQGSQYDCRKFGLYFSAVGPDVQKNDFLENASKTAVYPAATTTGKTVGTTIGTIPATSRTFGTTVPTMTTAEAVPVNVVTIHTTQTDVKPRPSHPSNVLLILLVCIVVLIVLALGTLLLLMRRRRLRRRRKVRRASSHRN